jgi:hypothetical protein
MANGIDWAGYGFIPLGHNDGHFIRGPGVFAFVRRQPDDERVMLFVDHADYIAGAAGPGHAAWADALRLGMNELHVFLKPAKRIDRLLIRGHLIKRCGPLLNVLEEAATPDWERCWRGVA